MRKTDLLVLATSALFLLSRFLLFHLSIIERIDLDTSIPHLLELLLVPRVGLLLGWGEVLALLLELLDLFLLLLLLESSLLLLPLGLLGFEELFFLGLGLRFGRELLLRFLATPKLFLLLLDGQQVGRYLLFLAPGICRRNRCRCRCGGWLGYGCRPLLLGSGRLRGLGLGRFRLLLRSL